MRISENIAFIDGQNLYMGKAKREQNPWRIDLVRFRIYLEQKYGIAKAYYFLGYVQEARGDLYEEIQAAGFVLVFREHNTAMLGKKVQTKKAELAAVAPGIAEALVATAIGLFAAIPAVVAYNRFARDIDRVAIKLETFIEEFSNILQRSLGSAGASSSASGH